MRQTTVPALLETHTTERPDQVFLVTRTHEFTYSEFLQATDELAASLSEHGLDTGDHIAIAMQNRAEYLLLVFAAAKLGCPVVSIDTEYTAELVEYAVEIADCDAIVYDATMADEYQSGAAESVDFDVTVGVAAPTPDDAVPFEALASNRSPPSPDVSFDSPFQITFSSGTTGDPKPILLPHQFWTALGESIVSDLGTNASDRYFANLTLAHGNPYLGVMAALVSGASIALGAEFSASQFWDDVRDFAATAVITHVTTAEILLNGESDRNHPGEVATFLGGHQVKPFLERFGFERVCAAYGSMEAGGLCTSLVVEREDQFEADDNIVGWERDGFSVRIVDDADKEVSTGEVGEILIRPEKPGLMFEKYYNMPEETVVATRNLWYHSGDLGYKDSEGRLHFVGRSDDSIRTDGRFVPIERVEQTVEELPGVAECAVVGVSGDATGEDVQACIRQTDDGGPQPEQIVRHCESELASYMVPDHVAFVDSFPRSTGVQKIQRGELAEADIEPVWSRDEGTWSNGDGK